MVTKSFQIIPHILRPVCFTSTIAGRVGGREVEMQSRITFPSTSRHLLHLLRLFPGKGVPRSSFTPEKPPAVASAREAVQWLRPTSQVVCHTAGKDQWHFCQVFALTPSGTLQGESSTFLSRTPQLASLIIPLFCLNS